jgi:hypothetical protein
MVIEPVLHAIQEEPRLENTFDIVRRLRRLAIWESEIPERDVDEFRAIVSQDDAIA